MFKVIIIDDEELVCEFIHQIIEWERLGIECAGCYTSSVEALKAITGTKPDLVITDIRLPVINGISLIKEIRKAGLSTSFIVISGYQDFEYVKQALELGVKNYILKPIDENELEKTILSVKESVLALKEESSGNGYDVDGLKEKYIKTRKMVKKQMLRDYLLGGLEISEEPAVLNERHGFSFSPGPVRVAVIAVDIWRDISLSDSQYAVMELQLDELLKQQLSGSCPYFESVKLDGNTVLLLNCPENQTVGLLKSLEELITKIPALKFPFSFDITIGLSGGKSLPDISAAYEEASVAVKSRVILSQNRVIQYGRHDFKKYDIYEILTFEWENLFRSALEEGGSAKAQDLVRRAFEALCALPGVDPENLHQMFDAIISTMRKELGRLYIGMLNEKDLDETARQRIARSYSKDALRDNLLAIVKETLEECLSRQDARDKRPVAFAKDYIAKNYMDKVSVADVADLLFLNHDYFSSLFKKEAGTGFSDYLINYRMTAAKQLIRSGKHTIAQIAGMVGYPDSKYFSKLFKKVTGVSPKDYKRLYL